MGILAQPVGAAIWEGDQALCPCRDIFSQGFGPFRWVCTSGDPQDLAVTDQLATSVLEKAIAGGGKAVRLERLEGLPGSAGKPHPTLPPPPLLIPCWALVGRGHQASSLCLSAVLLIPR